MAFGREKSFLELDHGQGNTTKTQWWIWLILGVTLAVILALFITALIDPAEEKGAVEKIAVGITGLLCVGVIILLTRIRLTTIINEKALPISCGHSTSGRIGSFGKMSIRLL